ncbi:hypothetical protein COO60DRAFT_1059142 [Scenedesmus sp. NREL 46B-D3]|nr:hypothetical protein COO60DRAFT_1059142 [Scenedesmus sp. NREL 46B-D3]
MGAHLSTVHTQVKEQFKKQDHGSKGYLTLKEVIGIRPLYNLNPAHVGVLYQVDKDCDGRFTLEELLAFASFAHSYARLHHTLDSSYMAAGLASLRMWQQVRTNSGREQFVDWAMQLFVGGYDVTQLEGQGDELYVHRKALKALHVLFDMERNLGVDYQALRGMMQAAAEEQQLLHPDNPDHDDWVPLDVLRLFTESLTDGMSGIMQSFFIDDAEHVLAGVEAGTLAVQEAAAAAEAAAAGGAAGRQKGANSSRQVSMRGVAGQKSTLGRAPVPPLGPPPSSSSGASRRGGGLGLHVTPLNLSTLPKQPVAL